MTDVFCSRHAVVWQFHDKRNGFSAKQRLTENECHENSHKDSAKVEDRHHKCAMFWEEGTCEKCIDRQFCGTAHERSQKNCHLAVTLRWECSTRHDTGNRASESDKHWDNASTGQTDFTEQFVHHESDARHVSAVFKHREEEEQRDDNRQEAQHTADTVEETVNHERLEDITDVPGNQEILNEVGQRRDACIEERREESTDDPKCQVEDEPHDADKAGDCSIFSGQDAVNLYASQMFFTFFRSNNRGIADFSNEIEAHVGDRSGTVKTALFLHLAENVLKCLLLVLIEVQTF